MSKVSSEYAKALFMLAVEKDSAKSYADALDLVSEVFLENPMYPELLASYGIPKEERLSALEAAFSDAIPGDVMSFLKLLCEKNRIGEFSDCVAGYKAMLDEMTRVMDAKVTSAIELKDSEKSALKEKLEKVSGHSVVISYVVDKSIIGGLVVEMDGKVIDSSLGKHLKEVKDVIAR